MYRPLEMSPLVPCRIFRAIVNYDYETRGYDETQRADTSKIAESPSPAAAAAQLYRVYPSAVKLLYLLIQRSSKRSSLF